MVKIKKGLKQRTRKSASKRFKVTATGKVLYRCQGNRHKASKKSPGRARRLRIMKGLVGRMEKKVMKMLAIA